MIESNPSLASLIDSASAAVAELSGQAARWRAAAPGRVNLIGEHTDYNEGWVLPMAIDRYTAMAAAPGMPGQIRVRSLAMAEERSLSLDQLHTPHRDLWMRYVQGVIAQYDQHGVRCPGLDVAVVSSVPPGGGLSSSAALELATAHLLDAVTGQTLTPAARIQASVQAEREMAGVPCGIMDQTVVELAESGQALLLDCADQTARPVPLGSDAPALLVIHCGVSHALAEGAYAKRRADCEQASALLGVKTLRDVGPDQLARLKDEGVLHQRANHVVAENKRVRDAVTTIEQGHWDRFGALMTASHRSLRDDYEVSCSELDLLVELATAEPGVHGARMTGGGFGGCVIVLVETDRLEAVADRISGQYEDRMGWAPGCYCVQASAGAREICTDL
ncbi:MAG: galactokinase [Luminiphilus sp.]|nr:galactokinase [Luminiphilus sp.]